MLEYFVLINNQRIAQTFAHGNAKWKTSAWNARKCWNLCRKFKRKTFPKIISQRRSFELFIWVTNITIRFRYNFSHFRGSSYKFKIAHHFIFMVDSFSIFSPFFCSHSDNFDGWIKSLNRTREYTGAEKMKINKLSASINSIQISKWHNIQLHKTNNKENERLKTLQFHQIKIFQSLKNISHICVQTLVRSHSLTFRTYWIEHSIKPFAGIGLVRKIK